jgi:hypothetical protein
VASTDQIIYSAEKFKTFLNRNQKERARENENWKFYDATDYGQWDPDALQFLIQEGRPPSSYNFIKQNVDTLAGTFLADQPDVNFETEMGEENDRAIILDEVYTEDKELGNWNHETLMMIRSGFIYRGWLEIFKDVSRDPRGRVGFRYRPGSQVVTDPDWVTHKVKDNKEIWLWTWMSPPEIKRKFKKKSEEIENAVELWKRSIEGGFGGRELDKMFDRSPEFYDEINGLYLVAQKMELVPTAKKRLFDNTNGVWVPDMPDQDIPLFLESTNAMGQSVQVIESQKLRCDTLTICPAMSMELTLAEGPHPIQTGGYPLFSFSSDVLNGKPHTPVDILKDPQTDVNKRESTTTHVLMTNAYNGLLIESDATENPEDVHKIGQERARPGFYAVVEPGANSNNKVKQIEARQPPTDFLNASIHIREMSRELTPAVPAVQAVGEGPQSGILYQSKLEQAQVGMTFSKKFLMAVFQDIGDAYFEAFTQIYTYPMQFTSKKVKGKIYTLNMPGGLYVKDFSRMRITVTQSVTSETYRRTFIQNCVATMQYIPDAVTKQSVSVMMIRNIPNIPEDELQELMDSSKLEAEALKAETMLRIATAKSQTMQLMQQMMASQGGGMPGAPPGLPPPPGAPGMPPQGGGQPLGAGLPPELQNMMPKPAPQKGLGEIVSGAPIATAA